MAGLFQNLSLHHIFICRKVVWHKDATFFFSSATQTDMKSKGSCLALVCVSIKFIDFIFFLVSLLTHFKRKTKQDIQKQTTKKGSKTKQNKINKNKTHTKSKRYMYVNFLILKISTLMWDSNLHQLTLLSHRQTLYQLSWQGPRYQRTFYITLMISSVKHGLYEHMHALTK